MGAIASCNHNSYLPAAAQRFFPAPQVLPKLVSDDTVGGPAKSDKPPISDGWNPKKIKGMFTTYQLVQDFATIHSMFESSILYLY